MNLLNQVDFTDDVIVCGHSLGGALAMLCGLDIKYNNPEKQVRVYTFGAPRVGNKSFSRSYNRRMGASSFHFALPGDPITKVPPIGFRPTDRKISLNGSRIPKHSLHHYAEYFGVNTAQWR